MTNVAIYRARVVKGMTYVGEQRRQAALDAMNVLDTPPDERIDRVTRLAKELFDVPMVAVNLIDRDRQWSKSRIGLPATEVPRGASFCQYTVERNTPFVVEDTTTSAELADHPSVLGRPGLRFYAGHPVHSPDGQPVGALCLLDTKPRTFSESQRELLRDMAHWVEIELGRDQQIEEIDAARRLTTPPTQPTVPGYTVAADSTAHLGLAGDFYDMTTLPGTLRVTLADVMGSGIGPALVAAGVRASLRTEPSRPVGQAMTEVDRLLTEDFRDLDMFVTAVHADIELATGKMELVDAGHGLAFIICRDGSWQPLRSRGLPLGMRAGDAETCAAVTATLEPGDHFVCCSDGLLDVLDPADPFGHVERTIRRLGPEGAVALVKDLAHDERATDDITVAIVRRDQ